MLWAQLKPTCTIVQTLNPGLWTRCAPESNLLRQQAFFFESFACILLKLKSLRKQVRSVWIPTSLAFKATFSLGGLSAIAFSLLTIEITDSCEAESQDIPRSVYTNIFSIMNLGCGTVLCWAAGLAMLVAIRDFENSWAEFSSDVGCPPRAKHAAVAVPDTNNEIFSHARKLNLELRPLLVYRR